MLGLAFEDPDSLSFSCMGVWLVRLMVRLRVCGTLRYPYRYDHSK